MERRKLIIAALLLAADYPNAGHAQSHAVRGRIIRMEATAFAQHSHPTASGTIPHEGIVAADPGVLPLGSRIRITEAGAYNGVYIVTDTGTKIVGRHIDLCLPTLGEARQFGRRMVLVRVLRMGADKQEAHAEDVPADTAPH